MVHSLYKREIIITKQQKLGALFRKLKHTRVARMLTCIVKQPSTIVATS